jgi:hypothetical protein
MSNEKRFSGRQITTIVVAVAVAIIAFPVGVLAATGTLVNITDPTNASHKAHVNSAGRLLVTADGTVNAWHYANGNLAGISDTVLGPTSQVINITSLTVITQTGGTNFAMTALRVPGTATDCSVIESTTPLYAADNLSAGVPLTPAFSTPVQVRPAAGKKVCLWVQAPAMTVDVSGYYGG